MFNVGMPISFGVRKVADTTIRRLSDPGQRKYEEFSVPIVEFDRRDIIDKEILNETAELFSEYDTQHSNFAQNIRFHFNKVFKKLYIMKTNRFNGIILPQDDYSVIEPKNILGLLETAQDYSAPEITYLQTNPKTNYWARNFFNPREYIDMGTGLVDFAKEMFLNKVL